MKKLSGFLFILIFMSFSASAQMVRIETVLGNIDIELTPDVAPNTVANFLNYVNDGDYNNSYFHYSVPNFVIQGGGLRFIDGEGTIVPKDPPIADEASVDNRNLRGTISMFKSAYPDSATSNWFINVEDNPDLDGDGSDGYTVFGHVVEGMDVVDAINELEFGTLNIPIDGEEYLFTYVPYLNDTPEEGLLTQDDAVMVYSISLLDMNTDFRINSGLNGLWHNAETSGSGIMIEVFPQIKKVFMAWFTYDTQDPDEGTVANVGYAGHRWLTGLGDIDMENNSVTFDLTNTSGGLFDNPVNPTGSAPGTYGSVTIMFNGCESAEVSYNLIAQELSNTFSLERVIADNIELCQSLYNQISD